MLMFSMHQTNTCVCYVLDRHLWQLCTRPTRVFAMYQTNTCARYVLDQHLCSLCTRPTRVFTMYQTNTCVPILKCYLTESTFHGQISCSSLIPNQPLSALSPKVMCTYQRNNKYNYYSLWFGLPVRCSNPRSAALKASMLTITPLLTSQFTDIFVISNPSIYD